MTENEFWAIIEACRAGEDDSDLTAFNRRLEERFSAMSLEELAAFRRVMEHDIGVCNDRALQKAIDPAGNVITGDDSWEAYGAWLIAQGREFHDAALRDPASAAAARPFRYGDLYPAECFLSAADGEAMRRTGSDLEDLFPDLFPACDEVDEDEDENE